MTDATPLASSAARQSGCRLDDIAAARAGARIRLEDVLGTRPSPPAPPVARFASEREGAVLRAMARQSGIAVESLRGSTATGAVRRPAARLDARAESGGSVLDVEGGFPPSHRIALSSMRQSIAERLVSSKREAPHYYMSTECVADALLSMRRDLNATLPDDEHLSINDLLLKLVAGCVLRHPALNAAWDVDTIARFEHVNLSVAVAVDGGLVTPVLRRAERMGLREIRREMRSLADAARRRALGRDAYRGGTFTVSNLGMYPVTQFAAILNPPQAAILAVAAAEHRVRPAADGGTSVRRVMGLTLSVDHRVADGVAAAEFLADLRATIEEPRRALL